MLEVCPGLPHNRLVIWGASGHALVVADIIRLRGVYEIVGFLDDIHPERHNTGFCGATVLGGQEQLDILQRMGIKHLIFGIGDCAARLRLSELARSNGFELATAIHPRATVADDVSVGLGTVIVAGAVVDPGVRIGENVIINSSATIGHESVLGDGVHVGPGVHLGGDVRVGRGTWIGIGAVVRDHVSIGAQSVVGAGALVLKSIPDGVVAYGTPAEVIRRNTPVFDTKQANGSQMKGL